MSQQQPAGWYPDAQGIQRYWDGTQWTDHTQQTQVPATQRTSSGAVVSPAPEDQRGQASLAHGLGAIGFLVPMFGWIGPLIIYLIAKPDRPYVKDQAAESLNFQLTLLIPYLIGLCGFLLVFPFLMLLAAWILNLALPLVALGRSNKGEWYRYPLTIRMAPSQ
ncbi:MAG: DUF4870 domain-containing protein [Microthrixaceae bacterium]